jgi:osmoprotectant transport system permease protein
MSFLSWAPGLTPVAAPADDGPGNPWFSWRYVHDNAGELLTNLQEHAGFTARAVIIALIVALPLAVVAYWIRPLTGPILALSGILYTIPSLALFQLLVPFTHLSRLTAEIALVSYTLLIIFRNTLAGLRAVPDDVRESAQGMGLTPNQILWRVELPLAVPSIIAGVRIATVTAISLATVAAFVVNEGLGVPIFDAIQRSVFKTEIFAAGGMAILLAWLADGALVALGRAVTPWARRTPA